MLLSKAATRAFYTAYNEEQRLDDRLNGIYDLLRLGYLTNAREAVDRLKATQSGLRRAEWLSEVCGRTEIYHRASFEAINGIQSAMVYGLPDAIEVRPPTDVMLVRAEKAEQVLIAFGGFSEAFWVPPPFFELSNCNVIALRDTKRLFHLTGIEGLGTDYAESVEGLKNLIKKLGVSKVFLTGSSAGGYAALRFALDLDARAVLAISPITRINADEAEIARFPSLRSIIRTQPGMMKDLLPLYQQDPHPPKLIIVWADKNRLDNEHAPRMNVLANVVLEPLRGFAGHPVWVKLLADHQLEPLLGRLLAS